MSRQATDQLYIELDYYYPEEYYVYTAEAQSSQSVASTFSCEVTKVIAGSSNQTVTAQSSCLGNKIIDSSSNLTVTVSVNASIVHIEGIELFAFSEAQIQVEISRIRDYNIVASASYSIATDGRRFRDISSDANSLVTQSTTAERSRLTSSSIEAAFSFSASIILVLDTDAELSVASTLSSTVDIVKTSVINISSQSTLSAIISHIEGADIVVSGFATVTALAGKSLTLQSTAISASSNLSTTKYFGSLRPRTVVTVDTEFDSSIKKYGTHSIRKGYWYSRIPPTGALRNDTELLVGNSEEFVIEFWGYRNHDVVAGYDDQVMVYSGGSNPSSANITFSQLTGADQWAFGVFYDNGLAQYNYRFSYLDSVGARQNINSSTFSSLSNLWTKDTWVHFAIRRGSDGVIRILRNNTQIASATYSGAFSSSQLRFVKMHSLNGTTLSTQYTQYDEFSYRIGNSTISGLSNTISSDFDTQRLLLHFDNTVTDDLAVLQSGTAAVTATVSLAAQANGNTKQTSANLSAAATVQATNTVIKVSAVSLSSEVLQSATGSRLRFALADLSTQSSLSTVVGMLKSAEISVGALFTPTVTVQAQLAGVATIESQITVSVSAQKTVDIAKTLSSQSSLTFDITYTAGADSQLTSTATQSTDSQRIRFAQADLSAVATVSALVNRIPPITAALSSEFAVSVQETKFRTAQAALSTTATQSTLAAKTATADAALSAQATQSADLVRIRFANSTAQVNATQSTTVAKTTDIVSTQSAQTTQNTSAVKTTDITVTVGALFTPSLDADVDFAGTALLESTSSLTALAGVIRVIEPNFNAGVASYDGNRYPRIGPLTGMPFGGLSIESVGFTVSIWARRRSTGKYQVLWSPSLGVGAPLDYRTALIIDNDNVRLRSTFDPDEPGATWNNAAPTDTEWHHYFFQTYRSQGTSNTPADFFRLWIDGQYQGERSYTATFQGSVFLNNGYLNLGQGTSLNIYDEATTQSYDMDFAQIWVGIMPSEVLAGDTGRRVNNRYSVLDFYNDGPVDLGSGQGVFGDLPQPYIYRELDQPWTTVSFEGTYSTADKAARLALTEPTLHNEFNVVAQPIIRVIALGDFTAQATQVTVISGTFGQQATVTATVTATATATQFTGIIGDLASAATTSATVNKTTDVTADLNTQATVTAQVGYTEFAQGAFTVQATLEIDIDVKPPVRTDAVLTAAFTVTADVASFTDAIALIASAGTLVCEATLIPPTRAEAALVSEFAVSATVGAIEQFAVLVASSGTVTVAPNFTASVTGSITSHAAVTTAPVKFTGIVANFTAFYSQLTAGDVVNIDPYLQLKITEETRTLKIHPEQRTIDIQGESRQLQIQGYEQ